MLLLTDDTKHLLDIAKLGICKKRGDLAKLVHFAYRIEDILKEIRKRTNYIGANRATKDGRTLVDNITYTNDEFDLDVPLTKDAMANVFIPLLDYSKGIADSYLYDEDGHKNYSVKINRGYVLNNRYAYDSEDNSLSVTLKSNKHIEDAHKIVADIDIEYNVTDLIGDVYKKRLTTSIEYDDSIPCVMKTVGGKTTYEYTKIINPKYDADTVDKGLGAESVSDVVITKIEFKTQDVNPYRINAGDWLEVEYDGGMKELYICHTNCTSNTKFGCPYFYLYMPFDFRRTIHYIVYMPYFNNEAALKAIDTHIENAIITYCIYRWFKMVNPEEAPTWYEEFVRRIAMITELLDSQSGAIMSRPMCYI